MDSHVRNEHIHDDIEQVQFKCRVCGHAFSEADNYDMHIQVHDNEELDIKVAENIVNITLAEQLISSTHIVFSESTELFNCDEGLNNISCQEDLVDHEGVHTEDVQFVCKICSITCISSDNLEKHMQDIHLLKCNDCTDTFKSKDDFERHMEDKHKEESIIPEVFPCNKCEYRASNPNELIGHKLQVHPDRETYIECNHCNFVAEDIPTINDHVETVHIDLALLNSISLNQKNSEDGFENFKQDLSGVLNKIIESQNAIIEGQNAIKQEMFIIRQSQKNNVKLDQLDEALELLSKDRDIVVPPKVKCPTQPPAPVSRPPPSVQQQPPPGAAAGPSAHSRGAPTYASNGPPHNHEGPAHSQVSQRFNTTSTCIIGDSISACLDNRVIERATNTTVHTAKAYSSLNDALENDARTATKFPHRGFKNVIDEELESKPTDVLIIQAGSVDISNLKTDSAKHSVYEEYFKQETIISAQNIFEAASAALSAHPELQKVVLMEQIPRYDTITSDPHAIKPRLSKLYNKTLEQLCQQSPLKNKLMYGKHTLGCAGGIRESRYVDHKRKMFDGVHLYGPSGGKAYTESVLSILRNCGLMKNSPPAYFRRYHSEFSSKVEYFCPTQDVDWLNDRDIRKPKSSNKSQTKYDYNVPTSNKFESLNW